MNIEDFKAVYTPDDLKNFGELIFERQSELMKKYVEIENQNGLRWTTDIPVNIHTGKGQSQLKDFAWRVMEEVFESLEVYLNMNNVEVHQSELTFHAKEELADGLHFLIELLILAGIDNVVIKKVIDDELIVTQRQNQFCSFDSNIAFFGVRLGRAMNLLKNKPWKQTQYDTDTARFYRYLLDSLKGYLDLMLNLMEPVDIMNFYFRKAQVNDFRIKSNY